MVICILGGLPASVRADEPQLPVETMTYGQTLGNIQLLEATVSGVPGQWSWTDPSIRPEAGTAVYEATFTPVDSNNYNTVTAEIPVTTLQAAPVVEAAPAAATIIYGAALSDSAIEGGIVKGVDNAPLAGSWSWEDGSQRPAAGTLAFTAIFTPTDTRNYTTAKASISVTIDQSTIDPSQITLPAASDITYGQTLADSILTGGGVEGIDGTWAWADASIRPDRYDNADYSDLFTYAVIFTPTDPSYATITEQVTLKLNAAVPAVTAAPIDGTISYGQSLSDLPLTGGKATGVSGEELTGTWAWEDAGQKPDVGAGQFRAIFTPDSVNYTTVACDTVTVTVLPAVPVVQDGVPAAAAIIYGQPLSDSVLTGVVTAPDGSPLDGSWSWLDGSEILAAGVHERTAVFTPADTTHYESLQVNVQVKVDKKAVDPGSGTAVTLPEASTITYRQTLADSILTGGSVEGIDGTWAWADPGIVPPAGTQAYDVTFTPVDTANYLPFTVSVTVIVNKYIIDPDGTDPVTLPAAGEVTYGQALAESALTGGSVEGIDGTWAWAEPETLPEAGSRSYTVVFTPADGNIESWTGEVTLIIHKATPVLTEADIPKASDIVYGQSIGDSILSFE